MRRGVKGSRKDQRLINNPETLAPVGDKNSGMIPPPAKIKMKTALFTNWTDEEFTGWWDGKPKKFAPGQSLWMPDYLARHFAKHLTNRELLRKGPDGKPVYERGETMTSPKFPEQVPLFQELFNKAYHPEEGETFGEKKDDID